MVLTGTILAWLLWVLIFAIGTITLFIAFWVWQDQRLYRHDRQQRTEQRKDIE